jgi:hypothetical protein
VNRPVCSVRGHVSGLFQPACTDYFRLFLSTEAKPPRFQTDVDAMQLTQSDPALRKKVGPEGFLEGEEEQDEGDLDSGGVGFGREALCCFL